MVSPGCLAGAQNQPPPCCASTGRSRPFRIRGRRGRAGRELVGASCGCAIVQAPRHPARGRATARRFGGSALPRCAASAPRGACPRAVGSRAFGACSAIRVSDARLSGTIMKYGASVLCVSVTLLGQVAPALAQDAPAGANLQAGGLKPPDAVQSEPNASATPTAQTEAELDRADKEDSGRGLEFAWLNAELGPQYVGLQAFKADNLVDGSVVDSKGLGMGYGAGIGAR